MNPGLWHLIGSISRFGGVGCLCALLNLLVLYVGTSLLHAHYLVSASVSFALLTPLSFFLHKTVSFKDSAPEVFGQATRYLLSLVVSAAGNVGLMIILVEFGKMNYLLSATLATVVIFVASYAASAFWVFRARH